MLFEFRKWWDYVSRGEQESPSLEPHVSGSARFREPGMTSVRLISLGDQPNILAMRLRVITGLTDLEIATLMDSVPTTLTDHISLSSAERIVDALRAAGAHAELLVISNGP